MSIGRDRYMSVGAVAVVFMFLFVVMTRESMRYSEKRPVLTNDMLGRHNRLDYKNQKASEPVRIPEAPKMAPAPAQAAKSYNPILVPKSLECQQCAIFAEAMKKEKQPASHERYLQMMYIETVKRAVTGYIVRSAAVSTTTVPEPGPYDESLRLRGNDWPSFGYAMTGMLRLNQLQLVLESVLNDKIEGDFIECGVWRGGTSLFARAVLNAYGSNKVVYVADSFQGLPKATLKDDSDVFSTMAYLSVPVAEVQSNFERFEVYDPQKVKFVKGFFNESMPKIRPQIQKLSILRLDGDMYESCFDIMNNLYDRLMIGGYLIVDDWNAHPCKIAVQDIRKELNMTEEILKIDDLAVYWRKAKQVSYDPDVMYKKFVIPRRKSQKNR